MSQDSIVIVAAKRTPMGGFQGCLSGLSASALGAAAIRAAVAESGVDPKDVDNVLMGCVLSAGQGQAPARQATLGSGLPEHVSASTVNKMCGSGMKTVMLAHDMLKAQSCDVAVAGGMESMSNAPYLLTKARAGMRIGHGTVYDHMLLDGLEDAYDRGVSMGVFAEKTAEKYGFTRQQQDEFALRSLTRARLAIENGDFAAEIAPVTLQDRRGETVIDTDEQPGKAKPEKIPTLRPAFAKDGTVTAANSSSISDGAAALLVMRASTAQERGLKPIARILGHSAHSHTPAWFTTAPVGAMEKLLKKTGLSAADVDLFEINEAFAVVTMAAIKDLGLDLERVNINGGACALGHPIGASGARILVTLISALQKHNKKIGVAGLCIGGGEATAMAVELL